MAKRETLRGVIRGNLGTLWGRYRPTANLSEDEVKGIAAERQDFGDRIREILEDVQAPTASIIRELRSVFHEIEKQPFHLKMPTAEEIAGRVRARLVADEEKPMCPACQHLGEAPGVWANTAGREKKRGQLPGMANDWWCCDHYEVLAWYTNRQARFKAGKEFPYPPPWCLIPHESVRCGAHPSLYAEFTDGALVSPLGAYVREYLETAWDEPMLDVPCLTPKPPTPSS